MGGIWYSRTTDTEPDEKNEMTSTARKERAGRLLAVAGVCAGAVGAGVTLAGDGVREAKGIGGEAWRWEWTNVGAWSVSLGAERAVKPLQRVRYGAELQLEKYDARCSIFVNLVVRDKQLNVIEEKYAPLMPAYRTGQWQRVAGTCVVPRGGASVSLQLSGEAPCAVLIGAHEVRAYGAAMTVPAAAHKSVRLENKLLKVEIEPQEWRFVIEDKRTGRCWETFAAGRQIAVTSVRVVSGGLGAEFGGVYLPANVPVRLRIGLENDAPEFSLQVRLPEDTPMPLWAAQLEAQPALHGGGSGAGVVVPLGEGFLFGEGDREVPTLLMQLGDGAGLTMPWAGVVDMTSGAAAMWFTRDEDDALARLYWHEGKGRDGSTLGGNAVNLAWMSQKGRWGYDRTVRYWFADKGGYVALAKRYRREAAEMGKFVTLAEKQKKLPQLARFRGAPIGWFNFLYHIKDQQERLAQMCWLYERGVKKMLFSSGEAIKDFGLLRRWGWLTTKYDLYSDMWPAEEKQLAGVHNHQIYERADDIMLRYNGTAARGWTMRTQHGEFPSYVLCPRLHVEYARRFVPVELKTKRYDGRFIDTTTALPLQECYHAVHGMTRSEDKAARRALLRYMGEQRLLCGSEIGCDWAVPEICYGEGLLSPVPFRHPRAGELPPDLEPVAETYAYQLNPAVRIPLWELVYHDCVVAYWYWGDTNNTFPELWKRRNLFNALYAVPAMYMSSIRSSGTAGASRLWRRRGYWRRYLRR